MADVRAALQQLRMKKADRAQGTPSIAVLPFANMSRDPDDDYFSDGLAEEIINALAQVPDLKVIARTLPYVGLADYHLALASVGGMPASEAMPRARQLATRALEIDPELAEAHAMLGIIAGHYDYDWGEAERRFRAAVKREPLSTHLRQWYASFWLLTIGRSDDALLQLARVIDEDPLCQMWHYLRSQVMERLGRRDEALDDLRTAIELDPKFWLGPVHLGILYAIPGFYHGCHSPVRAAVPPIGRVAERVECDEPRLTRHAACCRSLRVAASRAPGPGVTPTLEKLLGAMPAHTRSDP
jgi:tetratricopeptide (TPR) repeat protein